MTSDFTAGGFRRERTSAADQVLADLRTKILSGELAKGSRLPSERELSAYYDVSGPTVREAIRALSAMSLVDVRHGSGSYVVAESSALMHSAMTAVVELESIDLVSILDLSETLYQQVVSLAVEVASDDELAAFRESMEAVQRNSDGPTLPEPLRDFLLALVALSHNRLLTAMSSYLIETQIAIVRTSTSSEPDLARRVAGNLQAQRAAIVDALEARDRDAASAAIEEYMARGRELVRKNKLARKDLVLQRERA
ncbi:FadR/GntR family transcriptional regulator [Agromyces subbeticus]|uniref:FadR/GntR family transcriptional regulator n=1 Tax=Agromyces subbeticus TaxID=293890 RepID=UPI0003B40D71|nr:GntR family transcriptional regulator [Agromyces subbeticus]